MYQKILLPVDLSDEESWREALPAAVKLCEVFGASLEVLTILPDLGTPLVAQYFPADYEEKMAVESVAQLQALVAKQIPSSIPVEVKVGSGTIYNEILVASEKSGADLIVMGSHREALGDYLLGPNAARVVRHANCSVMVVRN